MKKISLILFTALTLAELVACGGKGPEKTVSDYLTSSYEVVETAEAEVAENGTLSEVTREQLMEIKSKSIEIDALIDGLDSEEKDEYETQFNLLGRRVLSLL